MHEQDATAFEPYDDVLATALDARDTVARQHRGHDRRVVRPRQPWIIDLDAREPPAFQSRRETSALGLDLGQLEARQSITSSRTDRAGGALSPSS